MRFLLDNNLSPILVLGLGSAGHDAVHEGCIVVFTDQQIRVRRLPLLP